MIRNVSPNRNTDVVILLSKHRERVSADRVSLHLADPIHRASCEFLLSCFHDGREIFYVQCRSTDQSAIDIFVGEQFGGIAGFHRSAVLNADRTGDFAAVHVAQQ